MPMSIIGNESTATDSANPPAATAQRRRAFLGEPSLERVLLHHARVEARFAGPSEETTD
jgi:hypothetical protein